MWLQLEIVRSPRSGSFGVDLKPGAHKQAPSPPHKKCDATMHGGGRTAADESAACTGRRRRARQTAEKADRTRKSSIWEIQTAPPRPKIHREMRVGLHLRWDLERGGAVWTTNIGKFWLDVFREVSVDRETPPQKRIL